MQDKREEILKQECDKIDETIFPVYDKSEYGLSPIFNAMDEYAKYISLEFIRYALKKMQGHSVDAAENVEIKYKGEWITPEQLFENFL